MTLARIKDKCHYLTSSATMKFYYLHCNKPIIYTSCTNCFVLLPGTEHRALMHYTFKSGCTACMTEGCLKSPIYLSHNVLVTNPSLLLFDT